MHTFPYLTSFAVSLAISAAILPLVIRLAHKFGAVDRPGGRRVHQGDIPRLGGIGIFLGFLGGVGAALLVAGRAHSLAQPSEYQWYGAAVGVCIIFGAGLLDDLFDFRPALKLALQLCAAGIAVYWGVTIDAMTIPFLGTVQLGILGPVLAVGWILLVTNAINLVDGLDGLAGGIALIVTTTMAFVAVAMGRFAVVILALALAGALVGFLRYNFSPARIFMGDGGSQFLGFTLAIISIRGSQKGAAAVAIVVPLLALGLPLLDLTITVLRRARLTHKEDRPGPLMLLRRIARADREHLHHNLLDLGWHPRKAVLTLYLIAALFALSGYLCLAQGSLPLAGLAALLSVGAVVAIKLLLGEGREAQREDHVKGTSTGESLSH